VQFGKELVVISRTRFDRAAVVAAAVEQIFDTAQGRERRQALEACLRDEFADIERQIAADRKSGDA
jgi:hypothetical protein